MSPQEAAVYRRISTAVAYHEAGHAVIDVALGHSPLRATVVVKPGREIVALVESAGSKPQSALDGCCALLAGYFAELRHSGAQGFKDDACNIDFEKVDEILRVVGIVADELTFEVLIAETTRLVDENWPAIERLAAKLLERETLSGEEIEAIYAAA
jgi:hypothetical protein